ncbi:MAG: sulfurtransferase [Candidatus Cloacimonadota bacterium]|nr:MAG: sulfurtransferase [Candidatus Cloacimonadota bacterium]PCJ20148.1 MAG: sulfurtransferase [Candidatus Cloacimonadota bacterium]
MYFKKIVFLVLAPIIYSLSYSNDFPLRKKYSDLTPISTKQLIKDYDKSVIVDVRSEFEYKVVHIQKAINLPLSKRSFYSKMKKKMLKNPNVPFVFYCNGITCSKSYKATQKLHDKGHKNIFVYDAGVFAWVKKNPKKSFLLGDSPVDTSKLIAKKDFQSKMLAFNDFDKGASLKESLLIDIRDKFQIKFIPKFKFKNKIKTITLTKLQKVLKSGYLKKEKTLYIYDAVGKQVRWLQYYLEKYAYKNYFFLKGGVNSVKKNK